MPEAIGNLSATDIQHLSAVKTRAKKPSIVVIGIKWPMETFLYRLLRGLADAGFSVTIASADKPDSNSTSNSKFRWFKLPGPEKNSLPSLIRFFVMLIRSKLFFRKHHDLLKSSIEGTTWREAAYEMNRYMPFVGKQWDIIYFPWNASAVSFLALFNLGIPVIVSCRGSQVTVTPHNPKKQYMHDGLRKTFQLAAAVHCVSEVTLNEARKYGLDPQKSRIIRPAVDPEFFIPLENKKSDTLVLRIITTGSLVWRKGYVDALIAIRKLVDKGIALQYEIIGDGEDYQAVLFSIQDMDLQEHVKLHGKLSAQEVRNKLQNSDVFLLTSLAEGISNAALEAMSCGLPVVTTGSGGMREAVSNGVEGFVVPILDPEAAAEALEILAKDPVLRLKMGEAARAKVLRDFTLAQQIDQFQKLCFEVIDKGTQGENMNESKTQYRVTCI
jgi:colanic acid/amylovoran biosynthesis glycosyltransferase